MSLTLEINGVDRTSHWWYPGWSAGDGGSFSRRVGGQAPGTFVLYDTVGAGGFRPTTGQSIVMKSSGTAVFGGIITDVNEDGLSDLDTGVRTTITAIDYQALPARCYWTRSYTAGAFTLKQILQDIVAGPLGTSFGVTLDPAQATGAATFTLIELDGPVINLLNQLQSITGWVWRIDPGKVLRMIAPATESSGLTLSDTSGQVQNGVSLKKQRSSSYANKVVGVYGVVDYAFRRDETVTASGSASAWTFDVADGTPYTDAGGGGTIYVGGVIKNSAVGEFTWVLDAASASATLTLTAGAPAAGTIISFARRIQPPFTVIRQDATKVAAEGPWPARYVNSDITDVDTAVVYTAALLARDKSEPWVVTVKTRAGLAWPAQTISLSFAERAVSGTYMVLSVDRIETTEDGLLQATMTCLEGSNLQSDWLDYFKSLTGSSSSAGGTVTGGLVATTVTTLAAPVFLGGSRSTGVAANPAAWKPAVNYVPFTSPGSFTARLRVDIFAQSVGVSVTARLFDVTALAAVAGMTTSAITSTTASSQIVTGNLTLGHVYRLELLNGTAGEAVFAIGTLEAV